MAPEERDRSFDKALARHLGSSTPLDGAASAPADPAVPLDPCPDAETLAAYHERSLVPQELNSWKEHIARCVGCQAILAQLEATDEIPLQAAEEEKVLSMKQSEPVMAPRSLVRWRWLAPAGALAAGLLVWVALHENQPLRFPAPSDTQIARNKTPAVPAPLPPMGQPASPRENASLAKPQPAINGTASSNARGESSAPRLRQKRDAQAESKAAFAKLPADKEVGARKDAGREALVEPNIAANQINLEAKSVGGAVQEKGELQTQAPAQAASTQSQNTNNFPVFSRTGPLEPNNLKKLKAASPPPAPAVAARAPSGIQDAASMQLVAVSDPRLIAAPGSTGVWRAGRAGLIEFSADGGKSWSRQTSGVIVDLLTGSAPSEKVCWIVGRVGTILLTTDGGAHWKLLTSPVGEDLDRVQATDALHATIWNVLNTKSFETNDGGVTWKYAARQ